MFTDSVKAKGNLRILVKDNAGGLKEDRKVENLVVTIGKNHIANRLTSNANVIMSHMAIGASNTAAVVSQSTLGSELARVTLDSTSLDNATATYTATFGAGVGTGTLTEAGIFNSGSTGVMLCRTNFNAVNKASGDTVVITWNVTIS